MYTVYISIFREIILSCMFNTDLFIYFTQARFEQLWRNFNTYTSGEQLLGLPVTKYDCLQKKKCVTTLQKLTLNY